MTAAKNIRSIAGVLSAFLILLSVFSPWQTAVAAEKTGKSFLWRVRSETATAYLLGSIHILKKDFYPLDKKIEDAFDSSSVLVVEANINDIGGIDVMKMIDSALYTGDDTIDKHLSPETYELLRNELAAYGIPVELAGREKPWFVALTLTSVSLLKSGFDPSLGIDQHFLSKAADKRIVELESLDYQLGLFSGLSDRDQELFLRSTIKELHGDETERLINAWKAGDAAALESVISKEEDKGMESFYEKILYGRNRTMAAKIEDLLRNKETAFVVVGAGHLVGSRGIVEILRKKGYRVEQL